MKNVVLLTLWCFSNSNYELLEFLFLGIIVNIMINKKLGFSKEILCRNYYYPHQCQCSHYAPVKNTGILVVAQSYSASLPYSASTTGIPSTCAKNRKARVITMRFHVYLVLLYVDLSFSLQLVKLNKYGKDGTQFSWYTRSVASKLASYKYPRQL